MFAYLFIFLVTISSISGRSETERPTRIKQPEIGLPPPAQDWWKWRNNPLYVDYWQRDPLRRPWTAPRPGYGFTYGPDTQYTFQTYDTPEFFGYDSNYPGGRTHFIGYRSQGKKTLGPQGQNIGPILWNKFTVPSVGPTTEMIGPLKPFSNDLSRNNN